MIKWLSFAIVFLGCILIFRDNAGCHNYYPFLYAGNDSTLTSSFVLVNNLGCDRDQMNVVISHIVSQRPEMILTLGSTSDHAFEFSETLAASLIVCDEQISGFKTAIFKRRLADFGLDTTSIPGQAYINFFDGAYNGMLVTSCRDHQEFQGYRGRIVIVGEMGSSNIAPAYDNYKSGYRVPYAYQGEESIYGTQLLAIILNSLVSKELIVDMPFSLTLLVFVAVVALLVIAGDVVLRKPWRLITKILSFKLIQLFFLALVFLSLFFASTHLHYVCDFNLFIRSILVGGELSFWLVYLLYRVKSDRVVGHTTVRDEF